MPKDRQKDQTKRKEEERIALVERFINNIPNSVSLKSNLDPKKDLSHEEAKIALEKFLQLTSWEMMESLVNIVGLRLKVGENILYLFEAQERNAKRPPRISFFHDVLVGDKDSPIRPAKTSSQISMQIISILFDEEDKSITFYASKDPNLKMLKVQNDGWYFASVTAEVSSFIDNTNLS